MHCDSCDRLPFSVTDADQEIRKRNFPNSIIVPDGCLVGPKEFFLPPAYKDVGLDIYNFPVRSDDIYLTGYMRSGTTLHCEMVWLIGNNLDYDTARGRKIDDRFPHIDFSLLNPDKTYLDDKLSLEDLRNQKTRRFIKAHIPLSLLPPRIFHCGSKVIYCARNPKDVIVSCYQVLEFFFGKSIQIPFEEYFRMSKLNWGWFLPYFEHVKEGWERRNDKNFLFLFYEDTIKDKRKTILKVAEFLEKRLTDAQVEGLIEHLDFENFKKNKSVNQMHLREEGKASSRVDFIRSGKTGSWREYFTEDLLKEAEHWMAECLIGSDLKFPET